MRDERGFVIKAEVMSRNSAMKRRNPDAELPEEKDVDGFLVTYEGGAEVWKSKADFEAMKERE